MPTAHTRFSYTFAELTDSAQAKAVEAVAEKLGGDWFDESDNDTIREDIVWELGRTLKAPGWDIEGAGDFRGIAGVTLDGWDLGQGDHLALKGTLDRDNAPALPWADGV